LGGHGNVTNEASFSRIGMADEFAREIGQRQFCVRLSAMPMKVESSRQVRPFREEKPPPPLQGGNNLWDVNPGRCLGLLPFALAGLRFGFVSICGIRIKNFGSSRLGGAKSVSSHVQPWSSPPEMSTSKTLLTQICPVIRAVLAGLTCIADFSSKKNELSSPVGDFPSKQGEFASKQGEFASKQGEFASKQGEFPSKQGEFPSKQGEFPSKQGEFPSKQGEFPSKQGEFAWKESFLSG
jgi:hypothetical protein